MGALPLRRARGSAPARHRRQLVLPCIRSAVEKQLNLVRKAEPTSARCWATPWTSSKRKFHYFVDSIPWVQCLACPSAGGPGSRAVIPSRRAHSPGPGSGGYRGPQGGRAGSHRCTWLVLQTGLPLAVPSPTSGVPWPRALGKGAAGAGPWLRRCAAGMDELMEVSFSPWRHGASPLPLREVPPVHEVHPSGRRGVYDGTLAPAAFTWSGCEARAASLQRSAQRCAQAQQRVSVGPLGHVPSTLS